MIANDWYMLDAVVPELGDGLHWTREVGLVHRETDGYIVYIEL
jgi:hypothetical protein